MTNVDDREHTASVVEDVSVADLGDAFARLLESRTDAKPPRAPGGDAPVDEPPLTREPEPEGVVPLSPESIVEVALFVGNPTGEPLSTLQLAELMRGVEAGEIDTIVSVLNARYDELHCPFEVAAVAGGFTLRLRDSFSSVRDQFYGKVREARLSQKAVDTLAIVAYHQPVDRARIEQLHGRSCGSVLPQLVRRKLLSVQRTEAKPRRMLYSTTDRFLEVFGLTDISELPNSEDI